MITGENSRYIKADIFQKQNKFIFAILLNELHKRIKMHCLTVVIFCFATMVSTYSLILDGIGSFAVGKYIKDLYERGTYSQKYNFENAFEAFSFLQLGYSKL